MKAYKIADQILSIQCENYKELTLTFFRFSEFYESSKKNLRGIHFSTDTFLEEMMDSEGNITYFTEWAGYNFPDTALKGWLARGDKKERLSNREMVIVALANQYIKWYEPFYIIGTVEGQQNFLEHETCHALYYLDPEYKKKACELIKKLPVDDLVLLKNYILDQGYHPDVLVDEMNSYLTTDSDLELIERFGINVEKHEKTINSMRKLFKKYKKVNKIKKIEQKSVTNCNKL